MNPLHQVLLAAASRGIALERTSDGHLRVCGSHAVSASELLEKIRTEKAGILTLLADPARSARDTYSATVEEISSAWRGHAAARRAAGTEPLWLDPELDLRLQAEIGEAIRSGDLTRALAAIANWRAAWLELLGDPASQPSSPGPTDVDSRLARGWVEIDSTVLSEHVVVALRQDAVQVAKAARPDLVVYTPVEVERLHGTQDADLIRAVHHAKKILGGVVQDPGLADRVLAEHDGSVLHKNQGVWDMFSEARARFGYRDVEERCLSTWLHKNAPNVAALWPDAPPTASWLDWRCRVGREHIVLLDDAWRESLRIRKEQHDSARAVRHVSQCRQPRAG